MFGLTRIQRTANLLTAIALLTLIAGCGADGDASAQEHFKKAGEYQQKGDLRAAVIELKNALQIKPEHADARALLGQTYVRLGDGASAEKELSRAEELGKHGPEVGTALVRALLLQGEYDKALKRLDQLPPDADPVAVMVLRGQAQFGLRQVDAAESSFTKALEKSADNVEARLGLARVAVVGKQLDKAVQQVDLAIKADPKRINGWLLKGEVELSRAKYDESHAAFAKALELNANSPAARLGIARALIGNRKSDEAMTHLDAVAKTSPNNPLVNYLKAVAAQQSGDLAAAQLSLREVLRVAPNHPESLLLSGSIHYMQKDFAQAEDALSRYVATNPEHVPSRKLLAAVSLGLRQPQKAISSLESVIAQAENDPQFLALLGSAYMSNREFAKATEYLDKAAKLSPDTAAIRTQLAISHLAAGSSDKAISELQTAVDMDPKFTRADVLLALTHIQKRDFDKALEAATTLAEKQPENPLPKNLMGAAYEGKGDIAKARANYAKALEIQPDYATAALNLARLDLRENKTAEAKKRYESVLEKRPNNVQALVALAKLASDAKRNDESIQLLTRARDNNPRAVEPRLILANYYMRRGEGARALDLTDEAAKIAPNNPTVLMLKGRAQMAAGERESALATFEGLAKRYPDSPNAHYQLALAQGQNSDADGARKSLDKTLELAPNHLAAKLALGSLLLRTGQPESAMTLAKRIEKEHDNSTAGPVLQGDIHMASKRPREATAAYVKAFDRAPNGPLLVKLYSARLQNGDASGAEALINKWLTDKPDDTGVRRVLASAHHQGGRTEPAILEYERIIQKQPTNVIALNN
ncbi:MAG: PEP-CTERM system TPR-repeat protein PrsT, partial [Gammaproteobacteria bacterium]